MCIRNIKSLVENLIRAVFVVFYQRKNTGPEIVLDPSEGIGGCWTVMGNAQLVGAVRSFGEDAESASVCQWHVGEKNRYAYLYVFSANQPDIHES